MTEELKKAFIKWVEEKRADGDLLVTQEMELEELTADLEMAFEAGAKEGGVKWHDLMKNPDDLPEYETEVIAITESDGSWYRSFETYYVDDTEDTFDGWSTCQKVIAWYEIPQFEE